MENNKGNSSTNVISDLIQEQIKENTKKENVLPAVVQKFNGLNKKVKLDDSDQLFSWTDLTSPTLPLNKLRARVLNLNMIINALEPGINSDIHFLHTGEDVIIPFTWQETKEFIIAAIEYRQAQPEYLKLKKQLAEATRKMDNHLIGKISRQL